MWMTKVAEAAAITVDPGPNSKCHGSSWYLGSWYAGLPALSHRLLVPHNTISSSSNSFLDSERLCTSHLEQDTQHSTVVQTNRYQARLKRLSYYIQYARLCHLTQPPSPNFSAQAELPKIKRPPRHPSDSTFPRLNLPLPRLTASARFISASSRPSIHQERN